MARGLVGGGWGYGVGAKKVIFKERPKSSNEMILKEENGKFSVDGMKLPINNPEKWGEIAKNYLNE